MSKRRRGITEDPDDDADWTSFIEGEDAVTDPVTDAPLVVFVHIQKTAGKTLRRIIRRQYAGPGRILHAPNIFDRPDEHWARIDELVASRSPDLEIVHGHMLFVPDRWPDDTRFVTILRDPVERTISHFYWLNERRSAGSALPSIETAIDRGEIRDNLQVRVLAGSDPAEPVTPAMGDDAIAALDRFAAVGLTERFDESLVLFGRTFGWRTAAYERVNATRSRVTRDALDPTTIERIEEHNRFDHALYAEAARRFEAIVRAEPDDFALEVDIVRAAVARTPPDGRWRKQPVALSTDGMNARALLVSAEASRLVAELDRQRLRAASRQIGLLQSELKSAAHLPGGFVDRYAEGALRSALDRIDDLEKAQRGAKRKIAKARKRRGTRDQHRS